LKVDEFKLNASAKYISFSKRIKLIQSIF